MVTPTTKYKEYIVEYSNDAGMVYLNGLDQDNFWIEIQSWEDEVSAESFAAGVVEALRAEGYEVDEENLDEYEEGDEEDNEID